ncbi:hypothetical protein [Streptomyces sp. NPDC005799]|uniref:hypothetical protein n=1 Tax=Streptomyces sp. NPDC005799 TaxID=3154678 RepID=UPI003403912E
MNGSELKAARMTMGDGVGRQCWSADAHTWRSRAAHVGAMSGVGMAHTIIVR